MRDKIVRVSGRLRKSLLLVALVGLTVLAYWPAVHAAFVWDDDVWITQNPLLHDADGLRRIWTDPPANPEYYPLTISNFWLDHHLFGDDPLGYHVVNILMHATNAALVAWLLWRLGVPGAWLAAAIFAVHPVNVESVAWAVERKNTLSGLLALLSLHCFLTARGIDDRRVNDEWPTDPRWLAASIALYALAVLAKTVILTLPGVMLVLVWWRRGSLTRRDWLTILPFICIGLPLGGFATWMQSHHTGATGAEFDLTWLPRCLVIGRAAFFYLGKLAWPSPLVFIYPKWTVDPSALTQDVWPILLIALLAILVITQRRLGRSPLAAVLIYGGMLLPGLGLFNVYWQRYAYVADHLQYHACIAMAGLFAAGMARLTRRVAAPLCLTGSAALLLVLGTLTWRQCLLYRTYETLLRDTIAHDPGSTMAHGNLASELASQGRLDEALPEYRLSLQFAPTAEHRAAAEYNLGVALESMHQPEEAILHYRAAIADQPDKISPRYNLGNLLLARHDYPDAIDLYQQILQLDPTYAAVENNLASAELLSGNVTAAAQYFQRLTELTPNEPRAFMSFGYTLLRCGKAEQAIAAYERAVQLDPSSTAAQAGLQAARRTAGQ